MRTPLKTLCLGAAITAIAGGAASAGGYSDASSYNAPYGMTGAQETAPINPSMRDANGNLTAINGVVTSSNVSTAGSSFSQSSGVQSASTISSGSSSAGMFGTATAIGNSLNVVTTGSNNTIIVNSTQTNNGNQTATVGLNGK